MTATLFTRAPAYVQGRAQLPGPLLRLSEVHWSLHLEERAAEGGTVPAMRSCPPVEDHAWGVAVPPTLETFFFFFAQNMRSWFSCPSSREPCDG